jgi:hypothetical protein
MINWKSNNDILVSDDGDYLITGRWRQGRYDGTLRFLTAYGPGVCNGTSPEELRERAEAIAEIDERSPEAADPSLQAGVSYMTQTRIGELYGLSAVAVGRILTDAGLKMKDGVTPKAITCNYAEERLTAKGIVYWVWNSTSTCEVVERALGASPKPTISKVVQQVQECLDEADKLRATDEFFSQLIEEHAYDDIPVGLANVVRTTLSSRVRQVVPLHR